MERLARRLPLGAHQRPEGIVVNGDELRAPEQAKREAGREDLVNGDAKPSRPAREGPRGGAAQSKVRIRWPISPPPAAKGENKDVLMVSGHHRGSVGRIAASWIVLVACL